jgi:uncharacterized membrane protein YbhN (UPF0104 family)
MAQVQERRPASNRGPDGAPPPQKPPGREPPGFAARLVVVVRRRRKLLRRAGLVFSALLIVISLAIFARTLMRIDPGKFAAAFAATSRDQILMAFGFTAISYLALTGYDGLALRHLNIRVPFRLTALASFASYAVSFTLGFPLVTGGAVRYWLYSPAGVTAGNIAALTVVAGVTFWLGMGLIVGVGFMFASDAVAEINHFNALANRLIGLSAIGLLVLYLGWVALMRWRGSAVVGGFRLPGPFLTLGQTALGVIDVCSASAALYVLLPKDAAIGFPTFATLYSLAAMLGIASHSPGGLGVFEATILQAVGGEVDALLAALLLFRAIYYLVPFVCAMALLGGVEAVRRWRSIREAMAAASDER